ncbi:MAG: 23S rRNA (guanosine(2251)-2'-O)-methyltransferase RlmB [Carbonactinosporaceae bacterium]
MAGGRGGGLGGRGNKPGSHRKGAQKGSGGKGRRALSGKGPTPPADKRPGHPAQRRPARAQRPARPDAPRPDAPRRDRDSIEVVAGRNAVVEALRAALPARSLHVAERIDVDDRVRESLRLAADRGLPLLEAPRAELDRLTGGAVHQGLALRLPPYDYAVPDELLDVAQAAGEVPLVVALDGVTDPRNLGAVVRSTAAFGGHGVVVPQRRSAAMTAGAWKASAGAAARVRVARATNLTLALQSYRKAGLFVAGLAADADTGVGELPFADAPMVLVVGAEGRGLSRLVRETCDTLVGIPMRGGAESLNAGVAAGIALYEIARRRR